MKQQTKILSIFFLFGFCIAIVQGQESIPATGGNSTGSGGSASYTVGQIVYMTNTGTNGSASQGVQQPFEVSVITALQSTEDIKLECTVYPNPTLGKIKLVVRTKDFVNLRYRLYDLNGVLIQDKKVDSEETEILMNSLRPLTYVLKVLSAGKEIKTFKIIKN